MPEPEKMDRTRGLWKNLLYTFLGTTISIILTFGTSQLLQLHRQAQDRKMSALMVMGNIERFARSLDAVGEALAWRDTLATILLSIPMDSLDDPANTAYTDKAFLATAATVLSYDKTAEKIFSNSIETWKNMGNFQFIDNVGECFSSMAAIETDYAEYIDRLKEAQLRGGAAPRRLSGWKPPNQMSARRGLPPSHSHAACALGLLPLPGSLYQV